MTVNPTIDITLQVDALEPTGKNRATRCGVVAGGGGVNVARAITELGGEAVVVHTAGGEAGRRLSRLLDEEGMDHVGVEIDGESREAVVILESDRDRGFHVVPPGPELSPAVAADILDVVAERAADHDLVVASGSLPPGVPEDFYARLAALVAGAGARLVLDTSGPALRPALEAGVHAVKPNRREASELIGREVEGFDDARRLNEHLLARGWAAVAASTVGERGAVVSADGVHHEIHTPPLPRPARSDAGAGDSFVAALTLGLAMGLGAGEAGTRAVATAAAAVLTPGTELFRRDDVEELLSATRVADTRPTADAPEGRR